jgi:hypothetical protein
MKAVASFVCVLIVLNAHAQERIDTDRPDQTESAVLVPKKYFQGEFGFGRANLEESKHTLIHPTFLLKYGLSTRFELRLESELASEFIQLPAEKKTTNLVPVEIGTKIALFEEKSLRPKTSLIVHLGLPFAATDYDENQNLFPSFRFAFQHTFTKTIGLGYNLGAAWDGYDNRPAWLYTFSPNFNIGKRWYGYVEAFGFLEDKSFQHNLDGGVAYYISNDTKLDLSGGIGLGVSPLKNYIALGFSFRFN